MEQTGTDSPPVPRYLLLWPLTYAAATPTSPRGTAAGEQREGCRRGCGAQGVEEGAAWQTQPLGVTGATAAEQGLAAFSVTGLDSSRGAV